MSTKKKPIPYIKKKKKNKERNKENNPLKRNYIMSNKLNFKFSLVIIVYF